MSEAHVPADVARANLVLAASQNLLALFAREGFDGFFVTGHRAQGLGGLGMRELLAAIPAVKRAIQQRLKPGMTTVAFVGMADGFDLVAGSAILQLQNEGVDIHLVACMPYPGFGKAWKDALACAVQEKMLERALEVLYASKTPPRDYDESCIFLWMRNVIMIAPSRWGLSCLAPKTHKGGTYNAVKRARTLLGADSVTDVWPEVALALGLVEAQPEPAPTLFDHLASNDVVAMAVELVQGRVVAGGPAPPDETPIIEAGGSTP